MPLHPTAPQGKEPAGRSGCPSGLCQVAPTAAVPGVSPCGAASVGALCVSVCPKAPSVPWWRWGALGGVGARGPPGLGALAILPQDEGACEVTGLLTTTHTPTSILTFSTTLCDAEN